MKLNTTQRKMLISLYQRYRDAKVNNGFSEVVLHNEFITSRRINDESIQELSVSDLLEIDEWFDKAIKFGGSINYSLSEDEIYFRQQLKTHLEHSNKSLISVINEENVVISKSNSAWKFLSYFVIFVALIFLSFSIYLWNRIIVLESALEIISSRLENVDDKTNTQTETIKSLNLKLDNFGRIIYLSNRSKSQSNSKILSK